MPIWENIRADIEAATGVAASLQQQGSIGGGCINQAQHIRYGNADYFVKLNSAGKLDMFSAEARGLEVLRQCRSLRFPEPVCYGCDSQSAWLVMEYLALGGRGNAAALGEGLADLHRITQPQFGWERENTIGSTPQPNTPADNWVEFWRERRLRFQLELAAHHGHGGRLQTQGEQLLTCFHHLFDDYTPQASLLHGDLWSGNHAYTQAGDPAIFDPAVYFGDREADIAMTELFGGFGGAFYSAYENSYPLDAGYRTRKTLYNLYHILNHLNMFGGGYLSQAQGMIDALLGELK